MLPVEFILACALNVAPSTVQAIVSVESGGNPLALNINGIGPVRPLDLADAILRSHEAIDSGHTVDIGYMQINSDSGAALGLSVEQIFDPCRNLRAGAELLSRDYQQAASIRGPGQVALESALSKYNTGSLYRGFQNGYVARYYGHAATARIGPLRPDPFTANPTVFAAPNLRPTDREGASVVTPIPMQKPPKV